MRLTRHLVQVPRPHPSRQGFVPVNRATRRPVGGPPGGNAGLLTVGPGFHGEQTRLTRTHRGDATASPRLDRTAGPAEPAAMTEFGDATRQRPSAGPVG